MEYVRKDHPLRGLCYVLAEAVYHNGAKKRGFRPHRAKWFGVSHWWLQNSIGQVIDPTADQFIATFPYQWGKPAGFLTKEPSKRAKLLMVSLDKARFTGRVNAPGGSK